MFEKICIILLANLAFFAKTLCYKYVSDDVPVWEASKKMNISPWKRRWLQFQGDVRVNQQEDHFITTIFHALVCTFIYTAFGATDISFTAAMLFSFNPINNQGSVWISGRSYVWSALLPLVAITFPYIAPFAILGMMHYPAGFVLSGILPIWDPYLMIFIILSGIFHSRRVYRLIKDKTNKEMFSEDRKFTAKKIILVIKTFGFYTLHALIPIKTTFYHSFLQSMAGSQTKRAYGIERFFWIGIICGLVMAYKIFMTPWDLMSFGICWWIIGLAPFLNAFRISQEIAERYTYAPLVGLMLALSVSIQGHPAIISAVVAMYATKLWFWMDAYQDDYILVESSCLAAPDAWFVWHVRALKRWDVNSHKEAMILWTMAKILSPNEFKVLFNLATMLRIHKQSKEADEFMNMAANNIPKGQEESSSKLVKEWWGGKDVILV